VRVDGAYSIYNWTTNGQRGDSSGLCALLWARNVGYEAASLFELSHNALVLSMGSILCDMNVKEMELLASWFRFAISFG
jgi:hypothetical protein